MIVKRFEHPKVSSLQKTPIRTVNVTALEPAHNIPNNNRFGNKIKHRYPLKALSKYTSNFASHNHLNQHDIHSFHHIYDAEGCKLSVDALINREDKQI